MEPGRGRKFVDGSARRRGRLVAALLFSLARAAGSKSIPRAPPTAAACPTCVFGEFQCEWEAERKKKCWQRPKTYAFDFRYSMGECWEEIPRDGRSVVVDVDMWCSITRTRQFLGCSNMNNFDVTGVALLQGCKGNAAASDLVRERCMWECKHNRPVARCTWEFAHAGALAHSRLRQCWLGEACNTSTSSVSVVCEPFMMINVSAEVNILHSDLLAATAAHREAEQKLREAQVAHKATNQKFRTHFGNLSAAKVAELRAIDKANLEHKETELVRARQRLAGVAAEVNETKKQLEANRTFHSTVQRELKTMLSQANSELNSTRDAFVKHQSRHNDTLTSFRQQKRSLIAEVARYEDLLKAEREAHDKTLGLLGRSRTDLNDEKADTREAESWLLVCAVAFGFAMLLCGGCVLFLLIKQRKWRSLAISRASNMGAQVVLGRPIGGNSDGEPGAAKAGGTNWPIHEALSVPPADPGAQSGYELCQQTSSPKVAWS